MNITFLMVVIELFILLYSVIFHEIAHGWLAEKLGDSTARLAGRLTLNPRSHIDPFMSIALPALLILVGSPIIIGGAKPVPINPVNFRNRQKDITYVSLAGPLTNLVIAVLSVILLKLLEIFYLPGNFIIQALLYTALINIVLGIFNLLPIPPLDGFKVVGGLLPRRMSYGWYSLEKYGLFPLLLFFLFFGQLAGSFLYPITNSLVHFLL